MSQSNSHIILIKNKNKPISTSTAQCTHPHNRIFINLESFCIKLIQKYKGIN